VITLTPSADPNWCHVCCEAIATIPRPEYEGFRPLRSHDVQRRGAVDHLLDFGAVRVAFLRAFFGKFTGEDRAVRVRQSYGDSLPLGCGRLRRAAAQRPQLGQVSLEIRDGDRCSSAASSPPPFAV
jgi:hypothetical protein